MSPPSRDDDPFHFDGFENPTTTPVPDVVFDRLLAHLGEAELKALLYVIRRTFGFKKDRDPISFNQFLKGIVTRDGRQLDEGCGIRNRTALSKALKSLENKGILLSEKGVDARGENTTTVYRLRFRGSDDEVVRDPYQGSAQQGVVRDPYHRSTQGGPQVVRDEYPQETVQQTDIQYDRNLSKGQAPSTNPSRPQGRWKSAPAWIQNFGRDFSTEFGDHKNAGSNITHLARLFESSGLEQDAFVALIYEARNITHQQNQIEKPQDAPNPYWPGGVNAMPYWFAVLADLIQETDKMQGSGS